MSFALSRKSFATLAGVHPTLCAVAVLAVTKSKYDFAISEGVRSTARQLDMVRENLSHTMNSLHLVQSDGFGHAIDVTAVGDLDSDGNVTVQDKLHTWDKEIYRAIAEAMFAAADQLNVQLAWGGEFKNFFDGPHFQLGAYNGHTVG